MPFWVLFGYGSHLKAKLFSTLVLACLERLTISTWNSIAEILHSLLICLQKYQNTREYLLLFANILARPLR